LVPSLTANCLPNQPFDITSYKPADQNTRDLVHRYYQEQVQVDGGRMDKFAAVSDAAGLVMGYYPTSQLPVAAEAANYVLQDNFFHAAFGGSFLNHQWLICACTPVWPNADRSGTASDHHSVLGAHGLPTKDVQLTTVATGDYAVNTIFPSSLPTINATQLPLQTLPTIGDRLTAAGVSWNWYSGGWNDAVAGHADPLFQYHHQPFNYYANYAVGAPGRAHLQDEADFLNLIAASSKQGNDCALKPVSFWKPIGEENEHPGYASTPNSEDKLVSVLKAIEASGCAKNTMVVVTYDEFGGQWDHVAPPGQGNNNGPHDQFGPGTRISSKQSGLQEATQEFQTVEACG